MKPVPSSYISVFAAMSLGLTSSGCSILFTRGPDVAPAQMTADTPVTCSGSVVAPVFDTLFTGTHIGSAIFGLTQPDKTFEGDSGVRTGVIAADLGLAAVHLVSALYGYSASASCREAKVRASELVSARREAERASAPQEAGVFKVGMARDAAAQACSTAGHVWRWDSGGDTCSGSLAGPGRSAPARLKFGRYGLWSIDLDPEAAQAATRADEQAAARAKERVDEQAARELGAHRGIFWTAWLAGREATACPDALRLLTRDSECAGAACRAPLLLSSGYERSCPIDADGRISLYRMRRRWEDASGTTISACLKETYLALTDPVKATTLKERCPGEGTTEAAFRDAARRRPTQADPPAPGTAK